jgi:hypothetical protein
MSRQGSVRIAQIIAIDRRIAAIDRSLDQIAAERAKLVDERNTLDQTEFHVNRTVKPIPGPIVYTVDASES